MINELRTKRAKLGIALIYLAGLGWIAELIIPFSRLPHKGITLIITLVVAELCFGAGVAVLGKPVYAALKARLIAYLRRPPQD
ncbi:MAG TPA: transporter suffix domain-containing protein [Candidatus Saccharimonadia bacterium]|nr:transporter suffix domain-containing protein [Candidatus Saccharimonadia bacterium]